MSTVPSPMPEFVSDLHTALSIVLRVLRLLIPRTFPQALALLVIGAVVWYLFWKGLQRHDNKTQKVETTTTIEDLAALRALDQKEQAEERKYSDLAFYPCDKCGQFTRNKDLNPIYFRHRDTPRNYCAKCLKLLPKQSALMVPGVIESLKNIVVSVTRFFRKHW